MDLLSLLELYNYALVLVFGLFLSVLIAGGWQDRREKLLICLLCPLFLLVQGVASVLWGVDVVQRIYPLIVHLPLVLILTFVLKKSINVALVSVCAAYLCCQVPNWIQLAVTELTDSYVWGEIVYTTLIAPIFLLLQRYFVPAARDAVNHSSQSRLLFGMLPLAYYVFDYVTVVYSEALYAGIEVLDEFLPTMLLFFYLFFLTAYQAQVQKRAEAELESSMLENTLKQSEQAIHNLRRNEAQTAVYQHNMRHHLNIIQNMLAAGEPDQAEEYIRKLYDDVEAVTPRRYCENGIVNLLCSSFAERAAKSGIDLQIRAKLPARLSVPDTELCSILSNGLENALRAVSVLEESARRVDFYCEAKRNKLLIEIKNPYSGSVTIQNGIPVSSRRNHGYGCRSIHDITMLRRGICTFETEDGIFILRVVLPLSQEEETV